MRQESIETLFRLGIRLWKWLGIEVRVSLFLVLYLLFDGFYFLREYSSISWSSAFLYWGMSSLFLFSIVLMHEYGHCFAGRAVGGSAERIILWPLGGLALVDAPHRPWEQFIVAAGGPAVNVAIMILMLPYIIWGGGDFGSFFLRAGIDPSLSQVHWFASMFYAINMDLFIFNLIPAFPMDGGRIMHAALWHRMGHLRATEITAVVAKFTAVIMVVVGVVLLFAGFHGLLLVGIGLLVWFGATHALQMAQSEAHMDEDWGVSFEPEREKRGLGAWWRRRKEEREQKQQEDAARKEFDRKKRVDELLEKVHREGMESLTSAEKRFLDDASRHYR